MNSVMIVDVFREKLKALEIVNLLHPYLAHQGHIGFARELMDIIRGLAEYGRYFHILQNL